MARATCAGQFEFIRLTAHKANLGNVELEITIPVDANSRTRYLDAYNFCHNIVQMKKGDIIKVRGIDHAITLSSSTGAALSDKKTERKKGSIFHNVRGDSDLAESHASHRPRDERRPH